MAQTTGGVGVVFVSHSEKIADGLIELASQMAPTAALAAAGGTDDGRIGTSFDKVLAAIGAVDSGHGVVVLCDLGSAILTAETALDFLDDTVRASVRIVDAPLVEGGVAASVAAQTGASLDEVAAAARSAVGEAGAAPETPGSAAPAAAASGTGGDAASDATGATDSGSTAPGPYTRTATLINKDGLHARPAAEFVKLASTFGGKVTVNGKDAKSLLGIMSLGLTKGTSVEIASADPAGRDAVDALAELVAGGFGEA
ncbi:dihydroxyacetone kinase phosphoryl donor subunit DhaM [Compostimonas suwonensis]|uniref:Phosphocarrier protein HPr n=1 Tax=Compostimonas suwonensis TaxID=1048394 RepID=A0A2M9BBF2_9MICO|nr:dihydroxyacetone kinase phosphoryl donor subunit DhaM [Compostimonas suwonensis]PJJ55270.1 PTS hybrid protein [Compostimonas suwonensis]